MFSRLLRVICVLSDDTILLVYWVYQADLELLCKLQMERWDSIILSMPPVWT